MKSIVLSFGQRILWCTYLGGTDGETRRGGLALDADDNVVIVGSSSSTNYPTTSGGFQRDRRGPKDSSVVKLKADGSALVFGTLLGGMGEDESIVGVRVDAQGDLHLAGHTRSLDFPVTPGAAQTNLGGNWDAHLAKLSADGSSVVYATCLGGTSNEFAEHRPWLEANGSVLLTGACTSTDFPTTDEAFQRLLKGPDDGFLVQLAPGGSNLVFATLMGGSRREFWLMPTRDRLGNIYLVGRTTSTDLPVTSNAVQRAYGGADDAFIVKLERKGRLSTRLVQGQFELGVIGEQGGRYSILTSTDLRAWSFWTNVSTTGSTVWLADEEASRLSLKAFRAVSDW